MLLMLITIPSQAVMKEDSLASTLAILRNELTVYHNDYSARQVIMKQTSQRVFTQLMQTMQRSNQNALMLYSQNDGYVFDLTYACHEAIEQYREFKAHLIPFRHIGTTGIAGINRRPFHITADGTFTSQYFAFLQRLIICFYKTF